jgi:hypothetical protein
MSTSRSCTQQLRKHLPAVYLAEIEQLMHTADTERALEIVLAFVLGSSCPSDATAPVDDAEWKGKQAAFRSTFAGNGAQGSTSAKRPLDDASKGVDSSQVSYKRQKMDSSPEKPVCTLHAISASAPIRKKVDVTITDTSIQLCSPSKAASSVEQPHVSVPLSSITRAFIVPTRGKSKPHWTVVLLTSDAPLESPKGKAKAATTSTPDPNREIVFGLDADAPAAVTYTSYANGRPSAKTFSKGESTLPALEELLKHLLVPIVRPSAATFRGPSTNTATRSRPSGPSVPSGDGKEDTLAGVDAHRGAKSGSLWFLSEGLLWTDARPLEFWALADIVPAPDGLRVLSATGRSCSVFITRCAPKADGPPTKNGGESDDGDTQEDGIETEFALIDGKEQDAINGWSRRFGLRFGKTAEELKTVGSSSAQGKGKGKAPAAAAEPATGKVTIMNAAWDDDDDDDEDFEGSDSDVGSGTEGGEDSGSSNNAGSDEDAEGEDAPGSDADADADEDERQDELDPAHHPLLRPGAMPKRVSKAVIDMVAGIMMEEALGGADGDEDMLGEEGDELEEDELDE